MACKHEFIGTAEGVKCSLCGLEMNNREFVDFLNGNEKEEVAEVKVEKKTTKKKTTTKK